MPSMAAEISAESGLDEDEVALHAVEGARAREGVSGTPLAQMRSEAVPCPAPNRESRVSWDRTHSGMRVGAFAHSESPTVLDWSDLKSLETSMCLRRRVSASGGSRSIYFAVGRCGP